MGAGADEAIPALVRSLRHANPGAGEHGRGPGQARPAAAAAVPVLERAAGDEDGGVRLAAVRALGCDRPSDPGIGPGRPERSPTPNRRRAAAAEAFGMWGEADERPGRSCSPSSTTRTTR